MTEETLQKAVVLEKYLYELKRAKENAENALDFDELTLQMRRAGVHIKQLDLQKIKTEAVGLITEKLNDAIKQLEEL